MGKLNFKLGKYKNQILAGLFLNLASLAHGTMLGWVSPTFHLLNSEYTPFNDVLTIDEESWIGSCLSVGAFSGTLLFGSLFDLIGRKNTLLLLGIPNLCSWITIFFSTEVYHLYIARILTGLTGGGLYVTIPIFIAEIADHNIRGSLGSMLIFVVNIGITIGYTLTPYLSYRIVPIITIWIPIIYTLSIAYLPETPRYLLLNDKEINAEMSYKFYTNFKGKSKEEFQKFTKDFKELKESLSSSMKSNSQSKLKIKDFTNPLAIKAIIAALLIAVLNQVTGCFLILNYSAKIFVTLGTSIDPNLCTIFMGVTQIIGTYLATMLVDRFGRKPLFNLSLLGMLLGLLTTGLYDYFVEIANLQEYSWIPIVTVSIVVFSASIGVNPLPVLIVVEMTPGKIRSIVAILCMLVISVIAFMMLKLFPLLLNFLNLYGVMWLFTIFCCLGIVFVTIFIPETKGKVLQENGDTTATENKC